MNLRSTCDDLTSLNDSLKRLTKTVESLPQGSEERVAAEHSADAEESKGGMKAMSAGFNCHMTGPRHAAWTDDHRALLINRNSQLGDPSLLSPLQFVGRCSVVVVNSPDSADLCNSNLEY